MPDNAGSNQILTIKAMLEGRVIIESGIIAVGIESILTEMDAFTASQGITLDQARDWAHDALKTHRYATDVAMQERLLQTLLWLACRRDPSKKLLEAIRHGGVTLECDYVGKEIGGEPGTLGKLRFTLSAPQVQ
jgi:hypothetical protein